MDNETLKELLVEEIRDIYDAEKQLTKALPKLAKAASTPELEEALRGHLEETQEQVSRLEKVFGFLKVPARGKSCKGMQGLIAEGNEVVSEEEEGEMRDLAIIAAAQRVEHYEISAYGTARTLAEHMELPRVVELLQATEDEEKMADEKLTEIAQMLYGSSNEAEGDEEVEPEEEERPARPQRAALARSR
jgi:ferritin-like metal-binding protein YciE